MTRKGLKIIINQPSLYSITMRYAQNNISRKADLLTYSTLLNLFRYAAWSMLLVVNQLPAEAALMCKLTNALDLVRSLAETVCFVKAGASGGKQPQTMVSKLDSLHENQGL